MSYFHHIKHRVGHKYREFRHNPLVSIVYFIIRKIFGPIVRLIWIKEVSGIRHIPRYGPVIAAFNHQSYFDFLCFIAVSPRNIHFLSAEKFFDHKLWSPLMKITGQIKVVRGESERHPAVHNLVHEHLDASKFIGIFPEGTRAPDNEKMLRPFTSVARYAIFKKVPIIPIGLKGTFEVMSRHDHKPKFIKTVSIKIGEPIDLSHHDHEKVTREEYRKITNEIMLKIAELSGKRAYQGV